MFDWLWRLTPTEVGLLLILGAICIFGGRMLSELRRVNHHLRALRDDEDWQRARAERELLRYNPDRRGKPLAQGAPRGGDSS
jgi:hypothetical protein